MEASDAAQSEKPADASDALCEMASHGGTLRNIYRLVAADAVMFSSDDSTIACCVTGAPGVRPVALWAVDPTATQSTFNPPGSVAQQIVVTCEPAA